MPLPIRPRHPLFRLALFFGLALSLPQGTRDARGFGWLAKEPPAKRSTDSKINLKDLPLKEGDIVFHRSQSRQSEAIRIATRSRFNHTAILIQHKGQLAVLEAVQPVKITSFAEFARRGNNHFVIKRLRDHDALLTPQVLEKMRKRGQDYIGKDYDLYFRWNDERIYCSELVWKLYKEIVGIEVGQLQKASDLHLDNPVVQRLIKNRYGQMAAIPVNESIISPQAIYESARLVTVYEQ